MLPPLSSRRYPHAEPPTRISSVSGRTTINASLGDLSVRRKAAIKKSFKRLDPLGVGSVKLQDALHTLAQAPILSAEGQKELRARFKAVAISGNDGTAVLTFAAFMSYYVEVSAGIKSESDFEQLLEAHWGYFEVSDILAGFQRQLVLTGLSVAFREFTQAGSFAHMTPRDFDVCLQRVGLLLRPEDLHRIFGAFFYPGSGVGLGDLKEQLVNPRPETPISLTCGLGPSGGPVGLSVPGVDLAAPASSSSPSVHKEPAATMSTEGALDDGSAPGKVDLNAELSRLEKDLDKIKVLKAKVDAAEKQPQPLAPVNVGMSRVEHHKYGHVIDDDIADATWKPDKKIAGPDRHVQDTAEHARGNYGAGVHGQHLSNYQPNDYSSLARQSFVQEYLNQTHDDLPNYWVPHLEGTGTAHHLGEYSQYKEDHRHQAPGLPEPHRSSQNNPWLPHLHGMGGMG